MRHYCGPPIEGLVLTSSIFHFGINQQTPVNRYYGLEIGEGLLNTVELQTEPRTRDSGSRWNHLPPLNGPIRLCTGKLIRSMRVELKLRGLPIALMKGEKKNPQNTRTQKYWQTCVCFLSLNALRSLF